MCKYTWFVLNGAYGQRCWLFCCPLPPLTATWLQGESSQLPHLIENIIPNNQKDELANRQERSIDSSRLNNAMRSNIGEVSATKRQKSGKCKNTDAAFDSSWVAFGCRFWFWLGRKEESGQNKEKKTVGETKCNLKG